jgi:hypothetical protein
MICNGWQSPPHFERVDDLVQSPLDLTSRDGVRSAVEDGDHVPLVRALHRDGNAVGSKTSELIDGVALPGDSMLQLIIRQPDRQPIEAPPGWRGRSKCRQPEIASS